MEDIENTINRIISGGFFCTFVCSSIDKEYDIYFDLCISVKDKLFLKYKKNKAYNVAKNRDILTKEQYLKINRISTKEINDDINKTKERLDKLKEDYFDNFYNIARKNIIKKEINKEKDVINTLYKKRYDIVSGPTCENYAENNYIHDKISLYIKNNNIDFNNLYGSDWENLKILYYVNLIGEEKIREVARSNGWRVYWNSCGKNAGSIFKNDVSAMSDEQLCLCQWSSYYDSVYESHERPADEIINDDIALDVWYKRKIKELEKDRKKDKITPKNGGKEVFVFAKNREEAKEIYDVNNKMVKNIMKKRTKTIKEKGKISEGSLISSVGKVHAGLFVGEKRNEKRAGK